MTSIITGYEYDVFISYRHNDNRSGWVTEFIRALQEELAATIKEPISVYFDTNPHDGLLETHDVDSSLKDKIKCLVFIPIISLTFCDTKAFAWQHEFLPFLYFCKTDNFGLEIKLPGGNVTKRVLPVRIHEIDETDKNLFETEIGGLMRPVDFIFKSSGVNRPLTSSDKREENSNKTLYRDQINKVANAIHEIIRGIRESEKSTTGDSRESIISKARKVPFKQKLTGRNVLRASVVYILAALVFWKVLIISSGFLHFTDNIIQLITLVLIVLFPFAMLLAWLYERSPKGFIRTGTVASMENPFSDTKKKPITSITFISLLLVTSIALFLLFPMAGRTNSMDSIDNAEKSIAVLPFQNISNDPEQEYFSEGMMQEILNHLFMIGGLKIPSSTSSMRFKGSKLSVREIATELKVSYVLEGNVSRSGDNVRIIVRLINGKNEQTLWTEDYNRAMTAVNLLDIQSDVAMQVAATLKIVIDPEVKKRIKALPTENTEAYTLFLQAYNLNLSFEQAKQKLERAIFLDPGYADAYAYMAERWVYRGGYIGDLSRQQVLDKAEPLLKEALMKDKNSILAHATLASLRLYYYWDFTSVEKEFRVFKELAPSNSQALYVFSDYLAASGNFEEAFSVTKNFFDQDKSSVLSWVYLALGYYFEGEQDKAMETNETALRLFPHSQYLIESTIRLFTYMGKYKQAAGLFEKSLPDSNLKDLFSRLLGNMGIVYFKTGENNSSAIFLNELLTRSNKSAVGSPSFYAAAVYTAMGEKDKAIQLLEKAYSNHEVEMYWLKVEPPLSPLHGDPRFENLLVKIGVK